MTLSSTLCEGTRLKFDGLIAGTLIQRINRFVARVALPGLGSVDAHCPNSGSMQSCSEPGRTVYLSVNHSTKRKLGYTWELIQMPSSLVGINTGIPNRLVHMALTEGLLEEFRDLDQVKREVKAGDSRLDFFVYKGGKDGPFKDLSLGHRGQYRRSKGCWIEVKNCTLMQDGIAYFPDAVTKRGQRHLVRLMELLDRGFGAAILFVVQRMDVRLFRPAGLIDPLYERLLKEALQKGVLALALQAEVTTDYVCLKGRLPISI